MNHSSTEFLQPYIHDIFAEETANGGPETLADLEHQIREAKRTLAEFEARLAVSSAFNRIVQMVELSPRRDAIVKQLFVHAEELLRVC